MGGMFDVESDGPLEFAYVPWRLNETGEVDCGGGCGEGERNWLEGLEGPPPKAANGLFDLTTCAISRC